MSSRSDQLDDFYTALKKGLTVETWELKLSDKQATTWGGGATTFELADQMRGVGESLETIIQNTGAIHHQNQEILCEADARNLIDAAKSAMIYAKRFENFPVITRLRFWIWDIGISVAVTILASMFALSILPAGLFRQWFQI